MESWSNQKYVKQIKIYFIFEILQSCHLCLDESFAHSWHSLNQLHEELSWRSSHISWALVGCFSFTLQSNSTQTISIGLRLGDCGGQGSSDAALHHSPSWSNSPYTTWSCVLGHCPVETQMIVPTKRKPDGMVYRCRILCWPCWLSVPWILNNSLTVSPAKHHPTSSSMLHGGNHTCEDHPFTYSASHKDTAVRTKNLTFGLIRPKDRFSLV